MPKKTGSRRNTVQQIDYASLGVLIVEDTLYMANLLRSILSGLGIRHIFSARSGEDALAILAKGEIDFAIMDDLEPPLDGLSVVRALRTSEEASVNSLPVIFVTTKRERRSIIEARDAGVTEILSKPFSAQQMIERIDTMLTKPREIIRSTDFAGPDRRRRTAKAENKRRKSDH